MLSDKLFKRNIYQSIAEFYRREHSERTKRGIALSKLRANEKQIPITR